MHFSWSSDERVGSLGVELKIVVSLHMGSRDQTLTLEEQPVFVTTELSLASTVFFLDYLMCLDILPACMCVHHLCAWYPQSLKSLKRGSEPWNWSCCWLWATRWLWGTEPGSFVKATSFLKLLTHFSSPRVAIFLVNLLPGFEMSRLAFLTFWVFLWCMWVGIFPTYIQFLILCFLFFWFFFVCVCNFNILII